MKFAFVALLVRLLRVGQGAVAYESIWRMLISVIMRYIFINIFEAGVEIIRLMGK